MSNIHILTREEKTALDRLRIWTSFSAAATLCWHGQQRPDWFWPLSFGKIGKPLATSLVGRKQPTWRCQGVEEWQRKLGEQNVNMRKWALGQVQHEELGDPDDEIYLYTFRWKDVTWCDLSILLPWASAAQFIGARSTEKRHTLQQGGKACASRCLDGNLNPAAACWWWPHGGPREDHCAPADSWHRDNSERLKADGVSNLMTLEPIGLKHVSSGFLWFEIGCWSIIVWTSTAARLAGKMNQREISWSDPRQVDEPQRSIYCKYQKITTLAKWTNWPCDVTMLPILLDCSHISTPVLVLVIPAKLHFRVCLESGAYDWLLWGWWSHCCKTEFTSKSEQWIQAETGLPWWTAVTGRCLE